MELSVPVPELPNVIPAHPCLEGVGGVDGGVDVEVEEHVEGGDESERVIFFKAKVLHTNVLSMH